MSVFATRLKKALENKNMKPSTLAYRIGVDRSTISNYLNGRYKAKSEMIEKMAQVLSVSSAWLDGFDVPMEREKKPIENDELSKGLEMLIELFNQIPEESQPMVIEMIRAALKAQGLVED
jgi:transcriptional regulator with XRE-family HTH domain